MNRELTADDRALIECAKTYRNRAYAPYSHFSVGAAVRSKSGTIYGGCNVENASYPLTSCAERVAICKAVSEGIRDFETIAIVADTPGPCAPCGACRQIISEFRIPRILMANVNGDTHIVTLDALLPFAFSDGDMT